MQLHSLNKINEKKDRKRVGRGNASGKGGTSGRGENGQKSRSGYKRKIGFEGGQNPLLKRIPKRGFSNFNHEEKYAVIDVSRLNKLRANSKVDLEKLKEEKIIKTKFSKLKIIGNSKVEKKLNVSAHKFAKSAQKAIEEAGGKAEVI